MSLKFRWIQREGHVQTVLMKFIVTQTNETKVGGTAQHQLLAQVLMLSPGSSWKFFYTLLMSHVLLIYSITLLCVIGTCYPMLELVLMVQ